MSNIKNLVKLTNIEHGYEMFGVLDEETKEFLLFLHSKNNLEHNKYLKKDRKITKLEMVKSLLHSSYVLNLDLNEFNCQNIVVGNLPRTDEYIVSSLSEVLSIWWSLDKYNYMYFVTQDDSGIVSVYQKENFRRIISHNNILALRKYKKFLFYPSLEKLKAGLLNLDNVSKIDTYSSDYDVKLGSDIYNLCYTDLQILNGKMFEKKYTHLGKDFIEHITKKEDVLVLENNGKKYYVRMTGNCSYRILASTCDLIDINTDTELVEKLLVDPTSKINYILLDEFRNIYDNDTSLYFNIESDYYSKKQKNLEKQLENQLEKHPTSSKIKTDSDFILGNLFGMFLGSGVKNTTKLLNSKPKQLKAENAK